MRIRPTSGYRDLFGQATTIDSLLSGISSNSVIKVISWINAQCLSSATPIERDHEILAMVVRHLGKQEVAHLVHGLVRSSGNQEDPRVFHSLYLTYFLHYELTHYRDIPDEPVGAEEELRIFKAYLVIVDIYNDEMRIPDVEKNLPDDEFFSQRLWPSLFKQYEFTRSVDVLLALIRVHLLFDELGKTSHSSYSVKYFEQYGCKTKLEFIHRIFEIIQVSTKSVDNKNKTSHLRDVPKEYHALLNSLSHPVVCSDDSDWKAKSLKSMKQYPLFKAGLDEYHVMNWNFLYRAIYQAIIRDFYDCSGISKHFRHYMNFKSWVGKEVTEKRLFHGMMEMIYAKTTEKVVFEEQMTEDKPDAFIRQRRNVVIVECKDTDVGDIHEADFSYATFVQDLEKKHFRNEHGKAKSILQLNRNINEIMTGQYPKEFYGDYRPSDLWVYPVLLCDGYLYSAPGINDSLSRLLEGSRTSKSAPLVVCTIEYLFRKIIDLRGNGLLSLLKTYQDERRMRMKRFQATPSVESAFRAFSSIEEVCPVGKMKKGEYKLFMREMMDRLGISWVSVAND